MRFTITREDGEYVLLVNGRKAGSWKTLEAALRNRDEAHAEARG